MQEDRTAETSETRFVGREHELRELNRGLRDALNGSGRLFLVSGEPGIGKSRLADETAAEAETRGATVLWGRCWEGGGSPAYWPWMQIFRRLARDLPAADPRRQPVNTARLLAHLMPEMHDDAALPIVAHDAHGEELRFRLFDAAHTLLQAAAAYRPLMLVLDDIHAADQASLLLLRFIARGLRGSSLLVIATYRDAEVRRRDGLGEAVAELARDGRSLPLRGLSQDDVARFIHASIGHAPSDVLVAALHGATNGNPFFVDELVRLMRADGRFELPDASALAGFTLPDHVRGAVRHQIRLLPPATAELLAVAAVIGQEFSLPLLDRVTSRDADTTVDRYLQRLQPLVDRLGAAVSAAIVHPVSEAGARYRFAHALFREELYDGLAVSVRNALHAAIGDAIETVYGVSAETPLADLAQHYVTAGSTKGLDYAERTAQDALRRLAYEESLHWYETALSALERFDPGNDQRRLGLMLGLGDAAKGAADFDRSRREFLRAADLARTLGLPEQLAQAALGAARPEGGMMSEPTETALLEEALQALSRADSRLRARVMLFLARGPEGVTLQRSRELIASAVGIARRLQDPSLLAHALLQQQRRLGSEGRIDEALTVGAEAAAVNQAGGDREIALYLQLERVKNHLWRGDLAALDVAIDEFAALATVHRTPWFLAQCDGLRGMRAALQGRFRGAGLLADQVSDQQSRTVLDFVRICISRETGSLPDDAAERLTEASVDLPVARGALAAIACDNGRSAEARFHVERAAAVGFEAAAGDWTLSSSLAHLAEACATLGDRASAQLLYDTLLPRAELVVSFNCSFCLGAAARYLGLLATTLGEWDRAAEHFEAAVAQNTRLGGRPWVAHTQHDYAAMLCRSWELEAARRTPASQQTAATLAAHARATAEALEMRPLVEKASALLDQLSAAGMPAAAERELNRLPPTPISSLAEKIRVFRRDGDYWTLTYDGVTCQLKHAKGLEYIAHLLRHPGEDVHATAIIHAAGAPSQSASPAARLAREETRVDLGDAGQVLDEQARAAYQRRLSELREELDEAESFNDRGRAARVREELETLSAELGRAVGLGGRSRRAGSHAERARVNVTRAISIVLKKIGEYHPSLAGHLDSAIKTGTFCSYQPGNEGSGWKL